MSETARILLSFLFAISWVSCGAMLIFVARQELKERYPSFDPDCDRWIYICSIAGPFNAFAFLVFRQ